MRKLLVIGFTFVSFFVFSIAFAEEPSSCNGLSKALENIPPDSPGYDQVIELALANCPLALERAALVALYNSTNGDSWNRNTNWLGDGPHCDWYGVTCNNDGYVIGIALGFNNLDGPLPPQLGNLSHLVNLNLMGNNINGPIPPELGNLSSLQVLNLPFTKLTGQIPPELGNLSNLLQLFLNHNQLTGPIPPELSDLSNVWVLQLNSNQITGQIPPELGSMASLRQLFLQGNQLIGCIPDELSNLNLLGNPIARLYLFANNELLGWETQVGLDWALSLGTSYWGPETVCQ